MKTFTIVLSYIKSTKNKHVYGNADSAIDSVYISKDVFGKEPEKTIEITVGKP